MDNQELVENALGGNPEACREIFERCVDMVFHISAIYTNGDREAAKDLAQVVFSKVFANLGSLAPPYHFPAWCARIAHNCGIEYAKKNARDRAGLGELARLADSQTPDPEQIMLINETLRAVSESFESGVEGPLKETARLFYKEDKSVAEIASELGVSQTAVTTRLSRFRARLRELVLKKLVDD